MTNMNRVAISAKLAVAMAVGMLASQAMAVTPYWNNAAGGAWGTASNWSSGSVVGGVDVTADFSHVNLTANQTITLNGNDTLVDRKVGYLNFKDTASPIKSWTISNSAGGILTLDTTSGHPTVTVDAGNKAFLDVVVAGNDGMTKLGNGTLVMAKTNTYTGPTSVQAGTLIVTGSLSANSPVTVASGAVLGGVGPVSDTVVNGTISPGQTGVAGREIGILSLYGTTTWAAGGHYDVGIASAADVEKGYSNDYVAMQSLTLPSSGKFNIDVNTFGQNATPDNAFAFDGFSGVYEWVIARSEQTTFDLSRLQLNTENFLAEIPESGAFALATSDAGHNLMLRYTYNAVPEATSMLLGSAAVMPLLMQRRRQRRTA